MVTEYKKTKWKSYFRSKKKLQAYKEEVYDFFTELYASNDMCLWNERGIRDTDRAEVDHIIIHHTKHEPWLTKEKLSAIELVRLYAPYYANPSQDDWFKAVWKAISSGHVRDNKQVFRPYHWLIRPDWTQERLLQDNEIWWHAWVWEMNCRSVAITIDDDLSTKKPTKTQLQWVANLIKTHYPYIEKKHILGHCEVNPKTECPWNSFLSKEGKWRKDELILCIDQT